jgi:hypothetical protein
MFPRETSVILTHGSALRAPIAELGNNGRNALAAGAREANDRDEIVASSESQAGE